MQDYIITQIGACDAKYLINELTQQMDTKPTEIKCTCGAWNCYQVDYMGTWSCHHCDKLFNAFGRSLAYRGDEHNYPYSDF